MRLVRPLLAAALCGALTISVASHAEAKEKKRETAIRYDDHRSPSGADVTVAIKTKSSDAGGIAGPLINGQTRTHTKSSITNTWNNMAAGCDVMFTDLRTKGLLSAEGSIALNNTYRQVCAPGLPLAPPKQKAPPPNPALLGLEAVTNLHLPAPTTSFGPNPEGNEWGMIPVHYNVWLWTDTSGTLSSSTTVRGYTVTLQARRTSLDVDMGDGTVVHCTATTPYSPARAPHGEASPTCGHAYTKASLPEGNYTVTTRATWRVTWTALGQSGVESVTTDSTASLPIGQLSAVLVKIPGT
ncbi:hypothetical protein [Aestuariimicrobium kwangyangense]|uniref:hypothetical protein n=1 Tax=Aestuariimicrobium kwangyangense TaxID=396389 RepID=UPI00146E7C55|nr:hypothetical protein [Aestuariimicrobium kwangyangense]